MFQYRVLRTTCNEDYLNQNHDFVHAFLDLLNGHADVVVRFQRVVDLDAAKVSVANGS